MGDELDEKTDEYILESLETNRMSVLVGYGEYKDHIGMNTRINSLAGDASSYLYCY